MAMTRREFARLGGRVGGMGLAAGALPHAFGAGLPLIGQGGAVGGPVGGAGGGAGGAGGEGRRLGYAMIGLGEIAKHFGGGVGMSQHSKITGLVSGDRAKAEQWATQYGVPKDSIYSYEDMDRMRSNKAIDAVYIGLPNSMHAEFTERSAKAGKHVLCEKPMCTTVAEGERMIAACRAAKVKLMIAYRMQYEPLTQEAIQRLRSGEIGEVHAIETWFGFDIQQGVWRTQRKLAGGGCLMDVGIYSLNATRYLTGEDPAEIHAFQTTNRSDPRFKDIEGNMTWTARFPSGVLASCGTTYAGRMPGYFKVSGSKGVLEMMPSFDYEGISMKVTTKGTPEEKQNPEKDPVQFMREADAFAENVFADTPVKASGEEGLKDIRAISRIYQAAGLPGIG